MNDAFKIFIDQLKDGKVSVLKETVSPDFLDVEEPELSFRDNVLIKGECYIANDALVMHLDIATKGIIPCSVCNEPVPVDIHAQNFYHLEPLENIKSRIFDMSGIVRESILLEAPSFAECQKGNCPKRTLMAKYLKSSQSNRILSPEEEGYQPFKDLHLEE